MQDDDQQWGDSVQRAQRPPHISNPPRVETSFKDSLNFTPGTVQGRLSPAKLRQSYANAHSNVNGMSRLNGTGILQLSPQDIFDDVDSDENGGKNSHFDKGVTKRVSLKKTRVLKEANKKVIAKLLSSKFRLKQIEAQLELEEEMKPKGMFKVHGKVLQYDPKSLFLFPAQGKFRQKIVWLIEWRPFETFIIIMIIVNSVVIAMYDQMDRIPLGLYNMTLDKIQVGLTMIFTVEAVLRIIGMGFIINKNGYLRSAWYWLDICTVAVGWLEFVPSIPQLKLFRTLRILRPLRSIHAIPGLKRLINSLLRSFTLLANVVSFLLFFLVFFSIIGTGIFKGQMYNRCHLESAPVNGSWTIDKSQVLLCSKTLGWGYQCVSGTYCWNPQDFGLDVTPDYLDSVINYGMSSFSNEIESLSTIFQVITMEGWTAIMYYLQDSGLSYQSPLFFLIVVVFCAFFLLNLILAAIMDSFEKVDKEMAIAEFKQEFQDVELRAHLNIKSAKKIGGGGERTTSILTPMVIPEADEKDGVVREEEEIKQIEVLSDESIFTEEDMDQEESKAMDGKIQGSGPKDMSKESSKGSGSTEKIVDDQLKQIPQDVTSQAAPSLKMIDLVKLKSFVNEDQNLTYNDEQLEEIEIRYKKLKIFYWSFVLARHYLFTVFIMLAIITNTFVLFMDKYPIEDSEVHILDWINLGLLGVFLFEMLVKLIAFGTINYFRDRFNIFDITVILFSLTEVIMTYSSHSAKIQKALIAFRALRFLRIFKLARKWTSLQDILKKMKKSFTEMLHFLVLLFVFIFIYALLGMELYSNIVKFDLNGNPVPCDEKDLSVCASIGESDRVNFDNFQNSMTAVFIIIVGDAWNVYQADYVRATNKWSIAYFTSLTVLGNIVMLNLFLAILLRQFDHAEFDQQKDFEKSEVKKALNSARMYLSTKFIAFKSWFMKYKCVRKTIKCCKGRLEEEDTSDDNEEEHMDAEIFNDGQSSALQESQEVPLNKRVIKSPDNEDRESDIVREAFDIVTGAQNGELTNRNRSTLMKAQTDIKSNKSRVRIGRVGPEDERDEDAFSQAIQQSIDHDRTVSIIGPHNQNNITMDRDQTIDDQKLNRNFQTSRHEQNRRSSIIRSESGASRVDSQINKMYRKQHSEKEMSSKNQSRVLKSNIFSLTYNEKSFNQTILNIRGTALYLFTPTNKFRVLCTYIVANRIFKGFIFMLVILSTINLALQAPLTDPNSQENMIYYYIDLGLSIAFAVECFLKIISRGFLWNGSPSYLRDSWSQLDFTIVVLSLASFISTGDIKVSKLLRNMRVVRPLRLIPNNDGLKIAVQSLVNSIKSIINVTIIVLFIFFVWGIFGVTFFKGLFYSCYDTHLQGTNVQNLIEGIDSKWDCINSGGEWFKFKNTFDNVFYAALCLFQISTTQGWVAQMLTVVDATEIDYVPQRDNNVMSSLYFIAFIFVGGLFTINLFQSVVISTYLSEKDKLSNNHLLTDMQREWLKVQIKCYKSRPKVVKPLASNKFRQFFLNVTNMKYFSRFIYTCIVINAIVMAINWYEIPLFIEEVVQLINQGFTCIFVFETAFKLIGSGKLYFKKFWNIFDFITITIDLIQIANDAFQMKYQLNIHMTILRILKVLKTVRLVGRAKSFKKIAKTFIVTLPSLANIALLLFLLFVFYAITGMNIFGRVMIHNAVDIHGNFQTFGSAFLTVFRCSTGENWNEIMVSLMDQRSIIFQCIDYPTYDDIAANGGQGVACGSYWSSVAFFLSFQMLVCHIFLNLFIAIILDGFDDSKQDQELRINDHMINQFRKHWMDFDPEGNGFIYVKDLDELIYQLVISKTGWIRGGEIFLRNDKQLKHFISLMELPIYNTLSHFLYYDVLSRLAQAVFKVDFERLIIEQRDIATIPNMNSSMLKSRRQTNRAIIDVDSVMFNNFESNNVESAQVQHSIGSNMQATTNQKEKRMQAEVVMKQNDDIMNWMANKDHLLFETYEQFHLDMMDKVSHPRRKIALNQELDSLKASIEWRISKLRASYDSRVLRVLPKVVVQMRKLVSIMRRKRQTLDDDVIRLQSIKEIEEIKFKRQLFADDIMQHYINLKRDDFFQIMAKTYQEEQLQAEQDKKKKQQRTKMFTFSNTTSPNQSFKLPKGYQFGIKTIKISPHSNDVQFETIEDQEKQSSKQMSLNKVAVNNETPANIAKKHFAAQRNRVRFQDNNPFFSNSQDEIDQELARNIAFLQNADQVDDNQASIRDNNQQNQLLDSLNISIAVSPHRPEEVRNDNNSADRSITSQFQELIGDQSLDNFIENSINPEIQQVLR